MSRASVTNEQRLGRTKPVKDQSSAPRLPHEHDESSDSQVHEEAPPLMRQAHEDLEAGRVDTDRGPPSNVAYQRQKEAPARGRVKRTRTSTRT
jgi:hypothetical protein